MAYRTGTAVEWDWGDGTASGKIDTIHEDSVTRTIKGTSVTRHGSDENPAFEIRQDDGTLVLKLATEVRRTR